MNRTIPLSALCMAPAAHLTGTLHVPAAAFTPAKSSPAAHLRQSDHVAGFEIQPGKATAPPIENAVAEAAIGELARQRDRNVKQRAADDFRLRAALGDGLAAVARAIRLPGRK